MKPRHLITVAVAAATLGMSTAGFARESDDPRQRHDGPRYEQRYGDRHGDRRVERRIERRVERRVERQVERQFERHVVQHPHGPAYGQRDMRIVHRDNGYRVRAPRWERGHYLPHEYRTQRHVVVNHRYHPQLYEAPRGHQWVQGGGGEFLLVALATGLIAHAIFNN